MLRGSLDDFGLDDVLWLIDRSQKTGELTVARPSGKGKVFFNDGHVYYAQSEFTRESLGDYLVRNSVLKQAELNQAEARRESSGEPLGNVLLSMRLVNEEQLRMASRDRIEEGIFELLRREFGQFSWEPEVKAEPEFKLDLPVVEVIQATSRRLAELEAIRRAIPSDEAVLTISRTPPEGVTGISVSPGQWRVLALVDGRHTVADISTEVGLNDFAVLKTLYELFEGRLLEVRSSGAEADAGESPPSVSTAKPRPFVRLPG
jgi:hypothetical protein